MTKNPSGWSFVTNHARILTTIAADPGARLRDLAERVGITERAAQRIVSDLVAAGYVERTRVGRRNRYRLDPDRHLRHPAEGHIEVGSLIDLLRNDDA